MNETDKSALFLSSFYEPLYIFCMVP